MTESTETLANTLIFFTTSACHLCEQALALLEPQLEKYDFFIQPIDIAEDDLLLERYATAIPVVYDPQTKLQLSWPFEALTVSEYFQACLNGRRKN